MSNNSNNSNYKTIAEAWLNLLSNSKELITDVNLDIHEVDSVPVYVNVRLTNVKICIMELLIRVRLEPVEREEDFPFLYGFPVRSSNKSWSIDLLVEGIDKIHKIIDDLYYDKRVSKFLTKEKSLLLSAEIDVFQHGNIEYNNTKCLVCNDVTNYMNGCSHVICFVCWIKGYKCPTCG